MLSGLSQYFVGIYYILQPTCIHQSLSELQVLCLEYIFCLYPLFLLFVAYILIELHARNCKLIILASKVFRHFLSCIHKQKSISDSIIHTYATFYFLSFSYIVYFAYSILNFLAVYDVYGKIIKRVLAYEHSINWFSTHHLCYAIPTILILLLLGVCPTLLLCSQTSRYLKKCCKFRPRTQLMVNTFVESFSSCYKDGLNNTYDFRFLTPLPMVAGLFMLFLLLSHKYTQRLYSHSLFSVSFLLLAFVLAFLRPYKSLYMNISISFHAVIVSINGTITILWFGGDIMSDISLASAFTFFSILPHIVAICTLMYKFLSLFPPFRKRMEWALGLWLSFFHRSNDIEIMTLNSDLPHRLEESNEYQRL